MLNVASVTCGLCPMKFDGIDSIDQIGKHISMFHPIEAGQSGFTTKDSGKREEFATGMVRDTQDDKPRYDLIDGAFLKRWAELMARGAKKYGENNWRKASTQPEYDRFRASAIRHLYQWLSGDTTEDHAAAVAFNLAGAEMVREKLEAQKGPLAF